ncbi:MAG TPA: hypothetical protein VGV15_08490, partial [Terriglobales bacterium]|nr:hypothetical protein [Terriglobales bacterium]
MLSSASMLYLPIKKAWIISGAARRVYFVCALAALSLFGVVMGSSPALGASGVHTFEGFPAAGLILRLLLWPGILGTALLSIAMWYFWFGFDDSGWLKKAIWFLPLYFL